MIVDLVIVVLLLISLIGGYKKGLVSSLLGLVGYLIGGVVGLVVAKELTRDWEGFTTTILALVVAIFLVAQIGQLIARSIGKGFRSLIGPLKIFDGALGALFGLGKALVAVYLLASLLLLTPWQAPANAISESQIFSEMSVRVPDSIDQIFNEIKSRLSS